MSEIESKIPHRAPFLFVKKIIDNTSDDTIITQTSFDSSLEMFQGHFPNNPIVPGVIITEAILQSGALLMAKKSSTQKTPVVSRIQQAKFKNILKPDEELTIEVKLKEELGGAYFFSAKAKTDKLIISVQFTCNLI